MPARHPAELFDESHTTQKKYSNFQLGEEVGAATSIPSTEGVIQIRTGIHSGREFHAAAGFHILGRNDERQSVAKGQDASKGQGHHSNHHKLQLSESRVRLTHRFFS